MRTNGSHNTCRKEQSENEQTVRIYKRHKQRRPNGSDNKMGGEEEKGVPIHLEKTQIVRLFWSHCHFWQ